MANETRVPPPPRELVEIDSGDRRKPSDPLDRLSPDDRLALAEASLSALLPSLRDEIPSLSLAMEAQEEAISVVTRRVRSHFYGYRITLRPVEHRGYVRKMLESLRRDEPKSHRSFMPATEDVGQSVELSERAVRELLVSLFDKMMVSVDEVRIDIANALSHTGAP